MPSSTEDVSDQLTRLKLEPKPSRRYNTRQSARLSAEENSPHVSPSTASTASGSQPSTDSTANSQPNNTTDASPRKELRTRTAVLLILSVFLVSLGTLTLVYLTFPDVGSADKKVPKVSARPRRCKGPRSSSFKVHGPVLCAGVRWVPLHLYFPPDVCYPWLHLPVHHLWVPVPLPPGPVLGLLLLCHGRLLLLPALLPGGTQNSPKVFTRESRKLVQKGR